jgi:dTDP-4-dehydrorhamnose reductase
LRTAWLYSSYGNNFVKTMIRLMGERKELKVIDDQIGSPTYAADLALVVMQIVNSAAFKAGIFHYSNEGRISWFQFAMAIREFIGSSCSIIAIPSEQYPTPARRPNFSLLDKSKIKACYAVSVPEWKGRLAVCIEAIKENKV